MSPIQKIRAVIGWWKTVKFTLKILQINLNHCRLAHYLLTQTAVEQKVDVVFISEPLFNPGNWVMTKGGRAAIWITNNNGIKRWEDEDRIDEDFTAVRVSNLTLISIYISPNITNAVNSSRSSARILASL